MNLETMTICFVDDEPDTIDSVVTDLNAMRLFLVKQYKDYDNITQDVIETADLFVLDVLTKTEQTPDAFVGFVRSLARRKPFIAFTTALEKTNITLPSRQSIKLRDFVLQSAGLGVISKRDDDGERWRYELRQDILEKILWFYWCTCRRR